MVEVHLTLRGEVGGKRSEVRLESDKVRVQVFTTVTQQPALDATFLFRELTDFRLLCQVQWTYVVVALVIAALMSTHLPVSIRELGAVAITIYVMMLPVALVLIAWLLPRNRLRIAAHGSHAEINISTFGRARALEFVAAVRRVRPDLPD